MNQSHFPIHDFLAGKNPDSKFKFWCHTCHRVLIEKYFQTIKCSRKLPPSLYHYTGLGGAYEILRPGSGDLPRFRFSTLGDLNDSTELVVGCNSLVKLMKKYNAAPRLIELTSEITGKCETYALVALSENRDEIPLWMAYGDKGKGVSIGLDSVTLQVCPGVSLVPVIYNETEQQMFLESFVLDLISWLDDDYLESLSDGQLDNLQRVIATAALMIKHQKWQFEREWRLIFRNVIQKVELVHGQLRRLEYGGIQGLIENSSQYYVDTFGMSLAEATLMFGTQQNPLTEIVAGSCVHPSQLQNLRFMLDERHLPTVLVEKSDCPIQ